MRILKEPTLLSLSSYIGWAIYLDSSKRIEGHISVNPYRLKVIRNFFKNYNKSLDGISGITKNIIFFHLKACERGNFDFCVFLRMCSMPGGRVWPGVTTSAPSVFNRTHYTQKSKFLLSQTFKWKKIMFLVIPEMPSTTFVMVTFNQREFK